MVPGIDTEQASTPKYTSPTTFAIKTSFISQLPYLN